MCSQTADWSSAREVEVDESNTPTRLWAVGTDVAPREFALLFDLLMLLLFHIESKEDVNTMFVIVSRCDAQRQRKRLAMAPPSIMISPAKMKILLGFHL